MKDSYRSLLLFSVTVYLIEKKQLYTVYNPIGREEGRRKKKKMMKKLQLVMLKGPREGETVEFEPGSKFKIGRLVRGKNVPIKDDGISSTHLEISSSDTTSLSSDGGGCRWFLKDLGSSNGTTLNNSSSPLPPHQPFSLCHGDVIKLGESTSILVRLLFLDNECPDCEAVRHKPSASRPSREVKGSSDRAVTSVQVSEKSKRLGTRNARRFLDEEREEGVLGPITEEKQELRQIEGRRKRAATRARRENIKNEGPQQIEVRRRRGATRAKRDDPDQLSQCQLTVRSNTRNASFGLVVPPDNNKGVRVEVKEEIVYDSQEFGVILDDPSEGKSRNAMVPDDNVRMTNEGEQGVQEMEGGRALHGLLSTAVSNGADKDDGELGIEAQTDNDNVDVGGYKKIEEENTEELKESGKEMEGAKEGEGELGEEEETVNLEMMTLGEWFSYLEVHLPKQIIDDSEKMLDEMQRKAERVHAYMIEQAKNKNAQV